ncbi:MAG: type I pullulanase [bacterium]|nr:type I pullulanase [bacterium]
MKKRLNVLLLSLLLPVGLISGCADSGMGPDEPYEQLISPNDSDVVSTYKKDTTDYSKLVEETTTKIRFHYRRKDDLANNRSPYQGYGIWAWDITNGGNGAFYPFEYYDDFGVFVDVPLDKVTGEKEAKVIGFLVTTEDWKKDPDNDRSIEVSKTSLGGFMDIYSKSGAMDIYTNKDDALKAKMNTCVLESSKIFSVYFAPYSTTFKPYSKRLNVFVDGNPITEYSLGEYNEKSKKLTIELNNEIDLSSTIEVTYKFDNDWTDKKTVMVTSYFDTEEFGEKYNYSSDDLGASFDNDSNPKATTFKVWAPTSSSMKLNLYKTGDYINDKTPIEVVDMTRKEKGIFETTVSRNLDGVYYTYTVTNSKGVNEIIDPYAKSAGLNGKRGMVINFNKINAEMFYDKTPVNFGENGTDASIYEMHIRDMTINENSGVKEEYRGKFLGLTESGTTYTEGGKTVSTGLDHLKDLGISHVQIMPSYDYNSVDESNVSTSMKDTNYNWGYDPQNYNCLEGSYSLNPADGYSRVKEFKQMMTALHNNGINVNMDVVYNHTGSTEGSSFTTLVPYYYYRTSRSGEYSNGSGCGNEVASERFMVNKFIRESCKFWVEEYGISGFRFDLMGLLDNQTMIDVYKDLSAINKDIMVYGEPWTGGTSKLVDGTDPKKLTSQKTVQSSLSQSYFAGDGVYVGAFNDVIRNAIRGDNAPGLGWVSGANYLANSILMGITGAFSTKDEKSKNIEPQQVINYASCHDNYTLYDQLIQQKYNSNLDMQYTQAESIVFTSQGVPFLQEGEEFKRTKEYEDENGNIKYEGNSYNVGDNINNMDYSLKIKNEDTYKYFKDLIALRKQLDGLSLPNREDINKYLKNVSVANNVISFNVDMSSEGKENIFVFHAGSENSISLDGEYKILLSNNSKHEKGSVVSGNFKLDLNESIILQKI